MSLAQYIRDDFKAYRIQRDPCAGFYSLLVGEIERVEKKHMVSASDHDVIGILTDLRTSVESNLALPNLSEAMAEKVGLELAALNTYLPARLSDLELRNAIQEIAQEKGVTLGAPDAVGKIMSVLKVRFYSGQFDNRTALAIIKQDAPVA